MRISYIILPALATFICTSSLAQADRKTVFPIWNGIKDSATLGKGEQKRWQTPMLPKGSYIFEMTGTGDADLYVRIGTEPTTTNYDCRPYKTGSNETCEVTLAVSSPIYVRVVGYAPTSSIGLIAAAETKNGLTIPRVKKDTLRLPTPHNIRPYWYREDTAVKKQN